MSLLTMAVLALSATPGVAEPGPAIGERLPALEAPDHTGRLRHFEDLRGPNGLVLVFFRSADW